MIKSKRKAKSPDRKQSVAPLCKLCKTRHWTYQAHQFKKTSDKD